MKPIKVTSSNIYKIEAALAEINGGATAHTYTKYRHIEVIVDDLEKRLVDLVGKKHAPGARITTTSGCAMPNAYKYERRVTVVWLERRPAGWYILDIAPDKAWKEGGRDNLILTKEQDEIAVNNFRKENYIRG